MSEFASRRRKSSKRKKDYVIEEKEKKEWIEETPHGDKIIHSEECDKLFVEARAMGDMDIWYSQCVIEAPPPLSPYERVIQRRKEWIEEHKEYCEQHPEDEDCNPIPPEPPEYYDDDW